MKEYHDEGDVGARIYKDVAKATIQAMIDGNDNEVDCLMVGLAAVCGAINATCLIVGKRAGIDADSSPEDQASTCNRTSALVAALLAARASDDDTKYLKMSMNPGIYLSAILAAQNILGRQPDDLLNPEMVKAARRWEQEVGPGFWGEEISENQPRRGALH